MPDRTETEARLHLPDAPAMVAGLRDVIWLDPTGEIQTLDHGETAKRLLDGAVPLVCHARAAARRLGISPFPAHDVLELFAFVHPARFCVPTIRGLCRFVGLPVPENAVREAEALAYAARSLLVELARAPGDDATGVAWSMARGNWPWGPAVLSALSAGAEPHSRNLAEGLKVWSRLREWQESGGETAPECWPVEPVEARARLVQLLGDDAEPRPQQMRYASHVSAAFAPREAAGSPHLVLAEAGTGVGKTLGYIAPASVWAKKNNGTVWISTFTRNLQRQLDGELDRLYPDPSEKARKVVVRKGRENTFCLLNYDEAVQKRPTMGNADAIALGLMARWALRIRDGDMVGGDFPGWLADLVGRAPTVDLTDTHGECIYAACLHYRKCFVERAIRRARRAEIGVANHALVMIQAALGGGDDAVLPSRYVFDEGHHVFGAADSAFSAHLNGAETADLRRWLLGAEDRRRSRSRGLRERAGELVSGDEACAALDEALRAAQALPGPGWRQRLAGATPVGPAETFLALVRQQVYARDPDTASPYSLETDVRPRVDGLDAAAGALEGALARLARPLAKVRMSLAELLDDEAAELDTNMRQRIDAVGRSLERRALIPIAGWRSMLGALAEDAPEEFVDWFGVERIDGREVDVGMHRHWIDPTRPFAAAVAELANGLLITSATLRDGTGETDTDWEAAEVRTGARHLSTPPVLSAVPSPFDYANCTRVFVVTDVGRDDPAQVAAAYRELFFCAGGGALGLFTAINRLRAVHGRIAGPLNAAGIPLLAQHVDGLDTGTLIDIFRAEDDACLLGTDAVRDGVDVPSRSLRLIVFDRVPWPRPDILHRERRKAFGGRAYDEMLTRLKLKQAYGRLVRRAGDRGVFVMLDRALPSRLLGAFPQDVIVHRLGLRDAVAETRAFLAEGPPEVTKQ